MITSALSGESVPTESCWYELLVRVFEIDALIQYGITYTSADISAAEARAMMILREERIEAQVREQRSQEQSAIAAQRRMKSGGF